MTQPLRPNPGLDFVGDEFGLRAVTGLASLGGRVSRIEFGEAARLAA